MTVNMRGLDIPLIPMGNVTSHDLFEDREQELFDLYERHKDRYRNVLDIGANIGVHTIVMAKLGWNVTAFEPDPIHRTIWKENLARNGVYATMMPFALTDKTKEVKFVRVLGNTQASHIEGVRGCYGPTETFDVLAVGARPYFVGADLAKVDAEGSEADILCSIPPDTACEILVEIGGAGNASRIFGHYHGKRSLWVQGNPWRRVAAFEDMPTHYRHGSLFIGEQP